MDWIETTQAVATLAAPLVGAVGLVMIWKQLRNLERSIRVTARGNIYEMIIAAKDALTQSPRMRPYFFGGKQVEQCPIEDLDLLWGIADLLCLYLERIAADLETFGDQDSQAWRAYARDVYWQSQALQEYVLDKKPWYSESFWELLGSKPPGEVQ